MFFSFKRDASLRPGDKSDARLPLWRDIGREILFAGVRSPLRKMGGPRGDRPVAPTRTRPQEASKNIGPPSINVGRPYDALVPEPGNAKYLSSAFPAWRKVKGAGPKYCLTLLMKISKVIITEL
jgi:hypothetical protein